MPKFVATLAAVVMMFVASPAVAGLDKLADGVTAVATSPLEVVAGAQEPVRIVDMGKIHPSLEKLNVVTDRVGGVVAGVAKALEKAVLGLVDVVTFPFAKAE